MKTPRFDMGWPDSWRYSYRYDLEEVYGPVTNHGYHCAYLNRRRQALALLTGVLSPGARILDLGAAQGNFSLTLAEMGYEVTWNDLRDDLVGYVQLKHEFGSLTFAPGNAFTLRFPHLFDAILLTEVIEHVAHPDELLLKAGALVRDGGYIVITTPNGGYFRNSLPKYSECPDPSIYDPVQFKPDADGHIFLLHAEELEALAARAGLVIEQVALFTNPLTNGQMKTGLLLRALPERAVHALETFTQRLPLPMARRLLIQMGARFRKTSVQ